MMLAAIQIGSAIAALVIARDVVSGDGQISEEESSALVALGVCVLVSAVFVWFARNKPRAWQTGLSCTGAGIGFLATAYMAPSLGNVDLALGIGLSYLPTPAGFVVGRLVGGLTKSLIMSRPIGELADSPLHLTFRSRRKNYSYLTINPHNVALSPRFRTDTGNDFDRRWCPLTNIKSVEQFTITQHKDYAIRNGETRAGRNSPGQAIRIRVSGEEWRFSTEEPERIVELMRLRIAARRRELDLKDLA